MMARNLKGRNLRKPREKRDHKYSRGVVAIVAGSKRFPGAALLTVGGARRGGAGYVKFLDSTSLTTELVIAEFPDVVPIKSITNEKIDALVVGPGATTLRSLPESIPIVLDSGALSLARKTKDSRNPDQIIVVTPHEGELRDLGFSLSLNQNSHYATDAQRKELAQKIADELRVICVLKGHRTLIAAPQQSVRVASILVNLNGGSELATAGSGDVLAGVVAAMFAQFGSSAALSPGALAALAVEMHARAGDLWRDAHGDAGALAHEIADLVPDAMHAMRSR